MAERVFVECLMAEVEVVALAGGRAAVFSTRSPAKDTSNEDAAALVPYGEVGAAIVVADGLGGMPRGGEAARLAVTGLTEAVGSAASAHNALRNGILNGIEAANGAIRALGNGATTVAVAEIDEGGVRPYHVGDSMILLTGQRGRVKLQTVPHSPVGYGVESGLIDPTEALDHEDRHIVSNVIGSSEMRVEIGTRVPMAPRDTLLLATDGLFDNFYLEEIVERVRRGPLERVGAELAAECLKRMNAPEEAPHPSKPDDLTFVLFRPTPNGPGR